MGIYPWLAFCLLVAGYLIDLRLTLAQLRREHPGLLADLGDPDRPGIVGIAAFIVFAFGGLGFPRGLDAARVRQLKRLRLWNLAALAVLAVAVASAIATH